MIHLTRPDPTADADLRHASTKPSPLPLRLAEATAFGGLLLYAVFAPHSIAGAWIALSISILGWLARTLVTRRARIPRRTPLDLPLWLFYAWSILSALLSAEPRISLLKLISVSSFLIFYVVRALVRTRRAAVVLAALMIASGATGALWSVFEVARGRGVVIEEIAVDSPFARDASHGGITAGDSVWRVGGRRVNSVTEIDQAIRDAPAGEPLKLSLFSQGEQVERVLDARVTDELKASASGSGLRGTRRAHRFRASGWTRHYQTFAETLQILAQLALGFALAYWQRRRTGHSSDSSDSRNNDGDNRNGSDSSNSGDGARASSRLRCALAATAFVVLAAGIALTAMRTVLVAFAVGASVVAWRAARGRARFVVAAVVIVALSLGAFAVWRTRAEGALRLQDESSRLRLAVARVAVARTPSHPIFGHGMDAVKEHWTEWGFPGDVKIHTHSTPIQLAFDRGLPALLLWLWLLAAFRLVLTRGERSLRADTNAASAHGLLLGATGALAGFFASSLVNYNFGDAEVALVLWWLMGTVVSVVEGRRETMNDE
ncbi:MAG: hypothetical protein QOG71_1673 [Pyrinomonadaceae bacterium]|nr:hypothetical protein [Pyrinomonadaceae bacterium]